jgi:C1A family cysteine protease
MKARLSPFATILVVLTFLAIPGLGSGGAASSQEDAAASVQKPAGFRWQMAVDPAPKADRAAEQAMQRLEREGVAATVSGNKATMAGQGSLEQLQTALFDTASPWIDFLGGPVELTLYLPADGTSVTLNLEARTTTGYQWDVVSEAGSLYAESGEAVFTMRSLGYGVPAIQTLQLEATGKGDTTLRLKYHRPFEPNVPIRTKLSLWMPAVDDVELINPIPSELLSESEILAIQAEADSSPYAELEPQALPASWDWRTQGIVPAVRDQGSCGSCWAFGTVGVMESAVKKGGGPLTDLSEQFLLSCNKDRWSCNGGLTATKYHYNTLAKSQTAIGAVLESAKPYTASKGTCKTAYSHPYRLESWAFIPKSESAMPTVDQLKNAIYTYGPVTAGVCADSGWNKYRSGVYKPTRNACRGSTNHQIVLVGWNDATSSWILRNSWGPKWGESGYMRIAYDTNGKTSRVGEGASWAKYKSVSRRTPH